MFGRLTLDAFNHEASQNFAVIHDALNRHRHHWPHFLLQTMEMALEEWLTSVDPKRIGIMYIIVVLLMFFKGFADALMMRLQQALSVGDAHGFISSEPFSRSLFCPWHDDDFLRRHGGRLWPHESYRSFANWGARCGLSLF